MNATEEKQTIAEKYMGALGWDWVDVLQTAMRRIMEISSSSRSRSRGCYSTATNPRMGKTTKRLPKRARGGSCVTFGESVWCGDIHERAQSGGGFGAVPSSPDPFGVGFSNRSGGPAAIFAPASPSLG